MVPRTRDFRITAADAARLRPRGWRGLLDAIGGARASFSRPLAAGLTTLGLVGLLVTTIPGALSGLSFGSAGRRPRPRSGGESSTVPRPPRRPSAPMGRPASVRPRSLSAAGPSAAASAPTQVKVDATPAPASRDVSVQAVGTAAPGAGGLYGVPPAGTKGGGRSVTGAADASAPAGDQTLSDGHLFPADGTSGASPLLLASVVCLVAGLGLFLARWGARRLARR